MLDVEFHHAPFTSLRLDNIQLQDCIARCCGTDLKQIDRLKAVRGLATEHNSEELGMMPNSMSSQGLAAASDVGSQHLSEDIDGEDRTHFAETMLLPGTAYDPTHFANPGNQVRRPASVVAGNYAEKPRYQRPTTILGSEGIGHADKAMLRKLVKEALEEYKMPGIVDVPVQDLTGNNKPRAGASLPSDSLSPHKNPDDAGERSHRSRTAATASGATNDDTPRRQDTSDDHEFEHVSVPASLASTTGMHSEDAASKKRVTLEVRGVRICYVTAYCYALKLQVTGRINRFVASEVCLRG